MKKRKTDVIFNNEKAKVIESDSRKMKKAERVSLWTIIVLEFIIILMQI
jgi:hypothetical protein